MSLDPKLYGTLMDEAIAPLVEENRKDRRNEFDVIEQRSRVQMFLAEAYRRGLQDGFTLGVRAEADRADEQRSEPPPPPPERWEPTAGQQPEVRSAWICQGIEGESEHEPYSILDDEPCSRCGRPSPYA